MTTVNSPESYTKNAVGHTRYSIHLVISFQLKSQPRYVGDRPPLPNLCYRISCSFVFFFCYSKGMDLPSRICAGEQPNGSCDRREYPRGGRRRPPVRSEHSRRRTRSLPRVVHYDFNVLFPLGDRREVGQIRPEQFDVERL